MKRQLFTWLTAIVLVVFLLPYASAQKSFTVEMKNAQSEKWLDKWLDFRRPPRGDVARKQHDRSQRDA